MNYKEAKELSGWRSGSEKAKEYMESLGVFQNESYSLSIRDLVPVRDKKNAERFDEFFLVANNTRIDCDGDLEIYYEVYGRCKRAFLKSLLEPYTANRKTMARRLKKITKIYDSLPDKQKIDVWVHPFEKKGLSNFKIVQESVIFSYHKIGKDLFVSYEHDEAV
jgi:hypothetical protein